ncbi:MAG: type II toxin-antitoxin system RelE/ParE family toxin [Anaeromyxobacteraceae bacterium]
MRIEIAPRALREAERCARWWRENRPAARELFEAELREALDQIRTFPQLGSAYEAMPGREHRRLLMPETRYHLYYRVASPDMVRVVAIWSSVRGRGPHL